MELNHSTRDMDFANLQANSPSEGPNTATVPFWQSHWTVFFSLALIALAAVLAYSNTFRSPFIFDDERAIQQNPTIRHLWPIKTMLIPPANGAAVQRRPVANVSLAINYAISGQEVWSYHVLNLVAHILAAWLLFGVVRQTLLLPQFTARWSKTAIPLALAVSLTWAVHPLLTEAVTYVVQRTEVLAGLFYLLALYCVIRGFKASHAWPWHLIAIAACALAMGSKEAALSAPVVILLYDRVFLSETWGEILRRRWGLYLGLAATWSVIIAMLPYGQEGTAVFGNQVMSASQYALSQCGIIAHYLKLAFWPHPLIVDYGTLPPQPMSQIIPYLLLMALLLSGTVLAFRYQPWLGFLGVWFFAILAPSSSVIPLPQQMAAEKRMYLPLAAVLVGVAVGCFVLARRWIEQGKLHPRQAGMAGACLLSAVVLALGLLAFQRNKTYQSPIALWQDTINKLPGNVRSYGNLGFAYSNIGKYGEAIRCYKQLLERSPNNAKVHGDLGYAYARQGQLKLALEYCDDAIRLDPSLSECHATRAMVLTQMERFDEAIHEYQETIRLNPQGVDAYINLGAILANQGREKESAQCFEKALELSPKNAIAHVNLAKALSSLENYREAAIHYREALRINPQCADAYVNLALLMSTCPDDSLRNGKEAVSLAEKGVELSGHQNPISLDALAAAYAESGRYPDAVRTAKEMIDLAVQQKDSKLVELFARSLQIYEAGKPLRIPKDRPAHP